MRGTVICVDSSKERGETFVKTLNDANPGSPKAFFYQCDVTHRENVVSVVDQITKDIGDITILVNCMETNIVASYFDVSKFAIFSLLSIDVLFHCSQAFRIVLPIMKGNEKGTLIFIRTSDFESRNAIQTLQEAINKELKESKADKVKTIVAHVFPKIAVTSDDSGMYGVIKPDKVAMSILEGVAKNRQEIFLPGYMIYCIFWIKLLPSILSHKFDNMMFGNQNY